MKLSSLLILIIIGICKMQAQSPATEYAKWTKKADSLYKNGSYKSSGHAYSMAFKAFGWKGYPTDRYNAACSWSLAAIKDSAFFNLEKIAFKMNYVNHDQIINDSDLAALHNDIRWTQIIVRIKQNKDLIEINFNHSLIKVLDSLVKVDQKWRNHMTKVDNHEINDSMPRDSIVHSIKKTDSLNYIQLRSIFHRFNFPNFDIVGERGASNFWLLVQHQDNHPGFQEEVLSKMKEEVNKGKASASDYAYLIDRVKVNTGQLQVYGTQMKLNTSATSFEPKPVIEPDKLNERRKNVGLPSIEDYQEMMNKRYYGELKNKKTKEDNDSKR